MIQPYLKMWVVFTLKYMLPTEHKATATYQVSKNNLSRTSAYFLSELQHNGVVQDFNVTQVLVGRSQRTVGNNHDLLRTTKLTDPFLSQVWVHLQNVKW